VNDMAADHSVRLAWVDDASEIARIQLECWRRAYADVLGERIAELTPDDLVERWQAAIGHPVDARLRVLVALDRAVVRGAAMVHPCHDGDADQVSDGEIGEFIVDLAYTGAGHGSRLLHACADTLRADGFTRAVWWLRTADDALRAFATSAGWAADGAHRELEAPTGATLRQVRLHTSLV